MIFTKKNPYGFLSYPSRKFYTFFHVGLIKFCLGIVEGRIYKMVPTPKMYPALIPGMVSMINITPVIGLYVTVGLNIGTYQSISSLITWDLTSKAITTTKEKGSKALKA